MREFIIIIKDGACVQQGHFISASGGHTTIVDETEMTIAFFKTEDVRYILSKTVDNP